MTTMMFKRTITIAMAITWTTTTTMAIVSQLPDWIETWDFCEDINCINDHNDDEDNDNNNNDDKNITERMTMSRVNLRDLIETGSFCKDIKGINDTDYDDDNKNDKGILNLELDRDLVSSVIHFQNSKLKPI